MNRKITLSIVLAIVAMILVVGTVIAGSSLDRGYLLNYPAVGSVNFYAWINGKLTITGMPKEIMTEDSYNPSGGPDRGYYLSTTGLPMWRIGVRNFLPPGVDGDVVSMVFGGIGANYNRYWYYEIDPYVSDAESITEHGIVGLDQDGPACPTRFPLTTSTDGLTKTVTFFAQPNKTYQIYRSQNSSGAQPPNGYSDGRYLWIGQTVTNASGTGSYSDTTFSPTAPGWWYEIILFDSINGLHGCHSEPAGPTAVEVADFAAVYDPEEEAVKFSWQTLSENNLVGFNIYRSESETGPQARVNDALIPVANPGSIDGAFYDTTQAPNSLWDTEIIKGPAYYYWLEVIKTEGSPSILSTVMFPVKDNFIFVPLINR